MAQHTGISSWLARLIAAGLLAGCSLAQAAQADDRAEWNRLNEAARPAYESRDMARALVDSKRVLDFALAHQKTLGPGDLATSWHNYGQVNKAAGNLPEARDAYEQALPLTETAYGLQSPHVSVVLNSMAILEHGEKNYARAEKYARRALAIARAEKPPTDRVAEFSNTLAWICFDTQRYAEAAELYQAALDVLQAIADPNDPRVVMLRKQLAVAKAGTPSPGIAATTAMAVAADSHTAFIEKIATFARQRNEVELLACFDEPTLKQQEAAIRQSLDDKIYKFFAASTAVASYEHVTRAAAADGREGLWHYGFVENTKHKLQPFQLAIIDTSKGPRLLYIDTGSCTAGRHPRVGPCK